MSMHEAVRKLRGIVPWLTNEDVEPVPQPAAPTPLESVEELTRLARAEGLIDRTSPTWVGVARWAATELIVIRDALETATDDKAAALRARAAAMRDLLADERTESKPVIEDPGPDTFT